MARGLDGQRPVDVEGIAASDDIQLAESEYPNPGYVASLVRVNGAAGILLAKNLERGRRRFSIAHELGHFHIPRHQKLPDLRCDEAALRAIEPKRAPLIEVEANQFAAELLMPFRRFTEDAVRHDLSLRTASKLASTDMYDVSVMAAARRMIETTREAGLLVLSEDGKVLWSHASAGWPWGWPSRGVDLHELTVGASVARGESSTGSPEAVDFYSWVDLSGARETRLLESAWPIPSIGQVMSIVWAPDRDSTV